jgi:hypothetical protein
MRRSAMGELAWTFAIVGAFFWLLIVAEYAHNKRLKKAGAVTAGTPTPTPIVNIEPTPTLTIPIRPAMGRAVGRSRAPQGELTFGGPEGVIVLPWGAWYDTVSADCARAALALVAREGAPGYSQYRDARFGRAYSVCPEFRR